MNQPNVTNIKVIKSINNWFIATGVLDGNRNIMTSVTRPSQAKAVMDLMAFAKSLKEEEENLDNPKD